MKRLRLSRAAQHDLIEVISVVAGGVVAGGAAVNLPPYLLFAAGLVVLAATARKRQLEGHFRRRIKVPDPEVTE